MAVRVLTPEEEAMHRARASSAGGRAASALLSSGLWRLPSAFPTSNSRSPHGPASPDEAAGAGAGAGAGARDGEGLTAYVAPSRQLLHSLRATGVLDADLADARATGWELAMSRVLISLPQDFEPVGTNAAIEDLLAQAVRRLASLGVRIDVLRTRDGCAVLRASTRSELLGLAQICELSKGFLEAVPYLAGMKDAGVMVETSCQHGGARGCLYTLTWTQASRTDADTDADATTAQGGSWAPSRSGMPSSSDIPVIPGIPGIRGSIYHLSGTHGSFPGPRPIPDVGTESAAQTIPLRSADVKPWSRAGTQASSEPTGVRTADHEGLRLQASAETTPGPTRTTPLEPPEQAGTTELERTGSADSQTPEQVASALATPVDTVTEQTMEPEQVAGALATPVDTVTEQTMASSVRNRRAKRHAWALRRGWLILLATIIAGAGGYWAGKHATITYSAQSLLDVRSGATQLGPGNAAEADSLAISYAAIIPTDTALLRVVASQLGVPTTTVEHGLSVVVERNTSVLAVSYDAPTSQEAMAGATLLAQAISDGLSPTAAIPPGSIVPVQMPKQAARSGKLNRYGLPLGATLGFVLGIVLVIAAERADPRADKASDLARAIPCPAAEVPGALSLVELSRILSLREGASSGEQTTTAVIPLDRRASEAATKLVRDIHDLATASTRPAPHLSVSATFDSAAGAQQAAMGEGPTVLAVARGERLKKVAAAAERLGLLGRTPVLAVLLPRAPQGH